MQVLTRSRRPRPEAQVAFDVLVETLEGLEGKGALDARVLQERVGKFVAVLQQVSGKMVQWKWDFDSETLREISVALPYGMRRLQDGEAFLHPYDMGGPDEAIVWDKRRSWVGRSPSKNLKKVFFDLVFDLLKEVGPWMRTCQREECGRLFLYGRPKQAFCSESCAQRVRMARFLEQRKAKSSKRPAKTRRRARGKSRA